RGVHCARRGSCRTCTSRPPGTRDGHLHRRAEGPFHFRFLGSSVARREGSCAEARARSRLRARKVARPRTLLTRCLSRAGGGAFGIPATLRSPPAKTRFAAP